jgi:gamma-glutamyltranspeptidase/glutathione hydrolase
VPPRPPLVAAGGVAATSQPLATEAAVTVLRRGGTAADAAVVAAAVLSVVEPHMTGIGGDVFALVWSDRERHLVGLDASGRSGSMATPEAVRDLGLDDVPYRGAAAVTVPGALSGWGALLERFGTLPLADCLEPAIGIAEEGFAVTPVIAAQWSSAEAILRKDAGASATFLFEGDRGPKAGDRFRNPDLAETFRTVARDGIDALYGGSLGARIVEGIQEMDGFLTMPDLEDHRPDWVDPISVEFRGFRVWELPPSGQGMAALQMLRILESFDLDGMGHNSAAYLHHLVEAKKLAFADLARYLADRKSMEGSPLYLLADGYLDERRRLLDPSRASEAIDPGDPFHQGETVYLAVSDQYGNMVSFVNSIFEHFGSGVVIPGTGFALQNRGAGFTLPDRHPNRIAVRKRPFHTLIPGFVTRDDEPWLAFGVMGGPMQPQGHVQLLMNLLVFDMDIQAAVAAPRFRSYGGRRLALEPPIPSGVREGLRKKGHQIIDESGVTFGGAQAILRTSKGWRAGSDPRKDGRAAGHD